MRLSKSKPSPSTAPGSRNAQHTQQSHDGSGELCPQDISLQDTDLITLADKLGVFFDNQPYEIEVRSQRPELP